MKVRYIAVLAALAAAPVLAADDHMHNHAAAPSAQVVDATGTVNKVDAAKGVVNVTHGPIPALGWPTMTMDFALEQKALANKVKPGQVVKFKIKKTGQTDYVVTAIDPVM